MLGMLTGITQSRTLNTNMKLKELIEETHRRWWIGNKDAHGSYKAAEAVVNIIGNLDVTEVTEKHIDQAVDALREAGNKAGTINRKLAAFSKVLRTAYRLNMIERMPHIIKLKEPKHRISWLSKEEEAELLSQPMSEDFRELLIVLVDTGMRLGEALKLQSKDCKVSKRAIHLWDTKSGEARTIPMTARVAGILEGRSGRVFNLNKDQVQYKWKLVRKAMNREGDPEFVIHMLRHTCASRLVQGGVNIPVIQAWLGHSNIATTMRYAHINPQNMTSAASVLES